MDDGARDYIDGIAADRRPLFDRIQRLILELHPQAEVVLSYRMPTYVVGDYRLHIGVWKHGLSFYGWDQGRDGGFAARHPDLVTGAGTIRLRPNDAANISDEELSDLLRGALGG